MYYFVYVLLYIEFVKVYIKVVVFLLIHWEYSFRCIDWFVHLPFMQVMHLHTSRCHKCSKWFSKKTTTTATKRVRYHLLFLLIMYLHHPLHPILSQFFNLLYHLVIETRMENRMNSVHSEHQQILIHEWGMNKFTNKIQNSDSLNAGEQLHASQEASENKWFIHLNDSV